MVKPLRQWRLIMLELNDLLVAVAIVVVCSFISGYVSP